MPIYVFATLGVGWLVWVLPFLIFMRKRPKAAVVDRRARMGVIIEGLAFGLVWTSKLWAGEPSPLRVSLSVMFIALGWWLSWTAVPKLGRQWRVDAGLNPDHELVQSGPYRFVRHPIYASMFAMLLGAGVMVARWWVLAIAIVVFIVGTEIRVRIEDGLLESKFGEQFREYRRKVRAYVPFVR